MYGDFFRARKKLKRIYISVRENLSKKTEFILLKKWYAVLGRKMNRSRCYCKSRDFMNDMHRNGNERFPSSIIKCSPFGSALEMSRLDLKSPRIWEDETNNALMDVNAFLQLIQLLIMKKRSKVDALHQGKCSTVEQTVKKSASDNQSDSITSVCPDSKDGPCVTNPPPLSNTTRELVKARKLDLEEKIEEGDCCRDCVLKNASTRPDTTSNAQEESGMVVDSNDQCGISAEGEQSLQFASSCAEKQQSFCRQNSCQIEKHGQLCSTNQKDVKVQYCEMNRSGEGNATPEVGRHEYCFNDESRLTLPSPHVWPEFCPGCPSLKSDLERIDTPVDEVPAKPKSLSDRIIYNTKPTESAASNTPVFVCSSALFTKKDALQFGEQSSKNIRGTDFNVNAICNKSPSWHSERDDRKPGCKKTYDAKSNQRSGQEKNKDTECMNSTDGCGLWWKGATAFHKSYAHISQAVSSCVNGDSPPQTSLILAFIAVSLVVVVASGCLLPVLGFVLDITSHAVLMSLVVMFAVAMFEGQGTSTSLYEGCSAFLQLVRCVVWDKHVQPKAPNAVVGEDPDTNKVVSPPVRTSGGQESAPDSKIPCTSGPVILSTLPTSGHGGPEERARFGDSDVSTMTDDISESTKPTGNSTQSSWAETMTDPVDTSCTAIQTDPLCEQDDVMVNYLPLGEDGDVITRSGDVAKITTATQVNIDVKAIYEQAQKLQQQHLLKMRRLQRKFLALRRGFQKDASDMKRCNQKKGDVLTQLQLTLPTLQREKNRLIAEKFVVERQYNDQKKKNQDLVGRITKLNQQFQVLGQGQQPVISNQWRPQQFLNQGHAPPMCGKGAQGDMQQQLSSKAGQSAVNSVSSQQQQQQQQQQQPTVTTKLTLPQPQLPPSIPNKWLTHLQQFQQQCHQTQSSPHQTKPHQQARLPIFKLLQNSKVPATTNASDESKRQHLQQQQLQQLQPGQQHHLQPQQQSQSQSQSSEESSGKAHIQTRPISSMSMLSYQQGDPLAASQQDSLSAVLIGQPTNNCDQAK